MIFRAGDCLLYDSWYPVSDWLIQAKTGSKIVHVEIVSAPSSSPYVASARFRGVDFYPFEPKNLRWILRPVRPFDEQAALSWFHTVRGQPYGYSSLWGYFDADMQTDEGGWTCSKLGARYLRAGGVDAFNGFPSGGIEPGDFMKSVEFRVVPK